MIQRIQSIYLILAATALGLQFVFPYAAAPAEASGAFAAFADGVFNLGDRPGLLVSTGFAMTLAIAAFFLFKNRPVQSRITSIGMFAATIVAVMLAVQFFFMMDEMGPSMSNVRYQAGVGMPAVSVLLLWLANRAIRKDEALVRSSDRLR
jgi:heme/copper-type cytochrome/quinol oxidase subunit 4